MTVEELQKLALQVKQDYDEFNTRAGRKTWDTSDYMAGFVGDVGDLSKLIMAKNGRRDIADVDEKLAHELADCLWSVFVIADELGIDVATTYKQNMRALHERVVKEA
ncbi:MAG: nucleotide pyrophosphohydrolase [Candidatus Saccharimonadales bacterium]